MTDEELIKRLRDAPADGLGTENLCIAAADRIEALVKERDDLEATAIKAATLVQEQRARAVRLEEALRLIEATTTPPVPIPWTHSVAADTYWQMIDRMKFTARAALKGADHV